MRSLKTRLNLYSASTLLVLVIAQWALVNYTITDVAGEFAYLLLRNESTTIIGATQYRDQALQMDTARLPEHYLQADSGFYFSLADSQHRITSPSLGNFSFEITPVTSASTHTYTRIPGPHQQQLGSASFQYNLGNQHVMVTVAIDLTDYFADIKELTIFYSTVSLLAFALLIAAQRLLLSSGLAPLTAIQSELRAMQEGEIKTIKAEGPLEIAPLIQTFNNTMAKLRERISRSRNATSNLSHALKTPLATLKQIASDPRIRDHADLHRSIQENLAQLELLIERELKRAQLAEHQQGITLDPFRPDRDCRELIHTLRRIYQEKNLDFELHTQTPELLQLDRQDMLEVIGNLLDNAAKWATHRVYLSLRLTSQLEIEVHDDGPGVPTEEIGALAQRGKRIDEHKAGHGMGLAIVKDAIDHYEGQLSLQPSTKLHGLCVTASIPYRPITGY